ncbi:hypothetical protein BDZ94DRAFT_797640 [Collybia nuda]|uniref:F-box domain-containing protein n=1 Tax=Collybia nuda TaxID=64659 RepID=A0A9P5Y3P7_9AGAR|nr:hypothetical protein BDZ94DRAFT_797640 [Collybia nuda]
MDHSLFTDKLYTNYTPSVGEAHQIKQLLVAPLDHLSSLDKDLARLQEIRNTLAKDVNAYQALLSPIRKVPQELLGKIFIHCLPIGRNAVMSHKEAPILFGRVCSAWRRVSLSTPALWASLHIPVPGRSEETHLLHLRRDAAAEWLARSGVLPLSVSISEPMSGDLYKQKQTVIILKMLIQFANRWRHIDFSPLTSRSLLDGLRAKDVPMLQSITIQNQQGIKRTATWDSLEFLHAPEIRAVAFSQMPGDILTYSLRWEQLTELRVQPNKSQPLSPHEGLLLLRRCPNLVNCWLEITLFGLIPAYIRPVTVPYLRTLGIEEHELATDPPFSIFQYLTTPVLHTLEFYRSNARGDPPLAFFAYLKQTTSLRSLSLDIHGFSERALSRCFKNLPLELFRLHIRERNHTVIESPDLHTILERYSFNDRVLDLLTPNPQCLLPELIVFECAQGNFSEASLIKFIRERKTAKDIGDLEHVRVTFPFPQTRDIPHELSDEIEEYEPPLKLAIDYYIKTAGNFQLYQSSSYVGLPLPGLGNAMSIVDPGCEVPSI